MEKIFHPAGERSPLVEFDFPNHRLALRGESYPENAAAFFGPLLEALKAYLTQPRNGQVVLDVELAYFNSSSAKALMNMFQMLEEAAQKGSEAVVNWIYQKDDDAMEEFGADFSEDFQAASFNMRPIAK